MINFKNIELSDKPRIDSVICASGCHGADYSFANLYIWRHKYNPQISFVGDRLIVAMPAEGLYAYPKGGGDPRESVDMIINDSHEKGLPLRIRGLTDKTLIEFQKYYDGRFELTEIREDADYCYAVEKLSKLPGRKLSSKRNHIKHFERNGDWSFHIIGKEYREGLVDSAGKEITEATISEAADFVAKFYQEIDNSDLEAETVAINEMFTNFDALGFIGAILKQNGEPVAFTAGTRLGDYAVDVHFEKALPDVEAAYTMVNREFANLISQVCPDVEILNREEDMGLEGLRKAKLSYQPDILMMKYLAVEK
ncbi:MAG: DUF2156 domain-containing protein [Clostridiales bacterium]|jgi:hypothetical protein|nr:DUF2156 domain-containing protein [Clostridiales bacterium]